MSITSIPVKRRLLLWGMAAGRCQYEGCNKKLYEDSLTNVKLNKSYIAHIVADKPDGPRGDKKWSEELKDKLSNIMLLCDEHHRLIDKEDVNGHPRKALELMKSKHEAEMERITGMMPEQRSHVVVYGAKIGEHDAPLNYRNTSLALKKSEYYPFSTNPIKLGMANSTLKDDNELYWSIQEKQLETAFVQNVKPLVNDHEIQHFSVFALAPQPLLIKLGTLLNDINSVNIYQKHRNPDTWQWQEKAEVDDFELFEPENKKGIPVLIFSLSGTVTDDRITDLLGLDSSIWKIAIDNPNNDFLKTQDLLKKFGRISHHTLDRIKAIHGQNTELHVFPAMPVSAAIELGRVWMPKADMPLAIYDQNPNTKGFHKALTIKHH